MPNHSATASPYHVGFTSSRRGSLLRTAVCALMLLVLPATYGATGFLYVLNDTDGGANQIYGFSADEGTGQLSPLLPGFPIPSGGNGEFLVACERLTVDPVNARLYVVNAGSFTLSVFSINPGTGALSALFSPLPLNSITLRDSVRVHPSGSPVTIGDASISNLASLVITATSGAHAPGSPYSINTLAFSTAMSQDGNFLYAGGSTAALTAFGINPATGALTQLAGSPFVSNGASFALATDASSRVFAASTGTVRIFTTSAGVPAVINGPASGISNVQQGVMHPNGFYMVANATGGSVAVFQIAGSGAGTTATARPTSPFSSGGGAFTNTLALNRAGTFLFAGNSNTRNISTFSVLPSGDLGTPTIQAPDTIGSAGKIKGMGYFATPAVSVNAGNNQSTQVTTPFATQLSVRVIDPVTGSAAISQTVTFTAPASGASGLFANDTVTTNAVTDASGIATASVFTANTIAGTYRVTASVSGSGTAFFTLTNTPGPAAAIIAVGGTPQSANVTKAFGSPLLAGVKDTNNNFVPGVTVTFTAPASGASGTFAGVAPSTTATAQTDLNGIATSPLFTANAIDGTYNVTATVPAGGLAPLPPANFALTNTPAPPPPTSTPPVVDLQTSNAVQFLNQPVTFTIFATDVDSTTLTYTLDFADGTPHASGQFQQGTAITVTHVYSIPGDYTVSVVVSDGIASATQTVAQSIPAPASGGAGVTNIAQNTPEVVNPINGIGISVTNSDGGVVQLGIDIDALDRVTFAIDTQFGDIAGRGSIVSGSNPVHQYVQRGLYIATITATDKGTGAVAGRGRRTLIISGKEVGNGRIAGPHTDIRATTTVPPNTIATTAMKGKFIFNAEKADSITYTGTVALEGGLDTSKDYEFAFAIGNIVANTIIAPGGKAKIAKGDPLIKTLKVTYVKLKKGAITKGGELAKVTAMLNTKGLVAAGFDTEGIVNKGGDVSPGKSLPRSIQVAMMIDGSPYQLSAPVTFVVSKDSEIGTISGRSK